MMDHMVRVESNGSIWIFDTIEHTYIRMPKDEKPREHSDWGDVHAGVLQDFVNHPYVEYEVTDEALRISVPGSEHRVYAPRWMVNDGTPT